MLAPTDARSPKPVGRPRAAGAATSGATPPRSSSAKAGSLRARCSWASSPATRRTCAGRPFVGPAGTLLRARAGRGRAATRATCYLTNAVKHFKWRPKGTRRIHDTPSWSEIHACDVWLRIELARVRPEVLVCLGGTAAKALLGRSARVGALRGRVLEIPELGAPAVVVTLHPSAVLRAGERRDERRAELVADLELVRSVLDGVAGRRGVQTADVGSRVAGRITGAAGKPDTGETKGDREMPPRGVKKGTKRARQYEHIKEALEEQGRSEGTAEEIAARTVNKERARHGEARESSKLSPRRHLLRAPRRASLASKRAARPDPRPALRGGRSARASRGARR